jgi:hypothetical protein
MSKATSVNGSGETPQLMQKHNTELVQKLLSITQNLMDAKNAPKDVQMKE